MHLPFWRTFPFRLALLLSGIFALLIGGVGLFVFSSLERSEMSGFERRLHSLAGALSQTLSGEDLDRLIDDSSAENPVWHRVHAQLRAIAAQEPDVESIYLMTPGEGPGELLFLIDASKLSRVAVRGERYDASQVPLMLQGFSRITVEDRPFSDEFGSTQSAYAPLKNGRGQIRALVGVDVLAVDVNALRSRVVALCIWLFGGALVVMLLVSLWLGYQVRHPLAQAVSAAAHIAQGNLDVPIQDERHDEFGLLARQFAVMVANLRDRERLRETFGLYISRELADSLLKEGRVPALGGAECVATVLFLDVQDFTRISETLSPTETIGVLNDYLGSMVDVIKQHRGCTLDFVGDGILTVFGAPFPQSDHASDAVRCALAMEEAMERLNQDWALRGLSKRWSSVGVKRVQIRIGLHTGPLVAGNIGSSSRMKYSVIGDTVNIAARLEGLNKTLGTSILLSEEVMVRVKRDIARPFVDKGVIPLRGRLQSVRVYSPA